MNRYKKKKPRGLSTGFKENVSVIYQAITYCIHSINDGKRIYFFLCRFFRSRFFRLCVAILWRLRFLPQGIMCLVNVFVNGQLTFQLSVINGQFSQHFIVK